MYWLRLYAKRTVNHSLPHYENERQERVNNSWSCMLGNLWSDRLHIVINEVLAAYRGKTDSNMLSALS
jgi:hypothetical protein